MVDPSPTNSGPTVLGRCHWHPDAETGLSCSRCGRGICPSCMVQAPVGIRCKECGKPERMPTYDVGTVHYARAVGVTLALAVLGGILWIVFNLFFGGLPFVSGLYGLGLGYCTGELLGLVVNRKRSMGLALLAGGAVVGAFLISTLAGPWSFGLWNLALVVVGVALAVQRVRP